jgi:hypothetical protein
VLLSPPRVQGSDEGLDKDVEIVSLNTRGAVQPQDHPSRFEIRTQLEVFDETI